MTKRKWIHGNPGSDEAIARGCKCAVLDNAHGKGLRGDPRYFSIMEDCPLHGLKLKESLSWNKGKTNERYD